MRSISAPKQDTSHARPNYYSHLSRRISEPDVEAFDLRANAVRCEMRRRRLFQMSPAPPAEYRQLIHQRPYYYHVALRSHELIHSKAILGHARSTKWRIQLWQPRFPPSHLSPSFRAARRPWAPPPRSRRCCLNIEVLRKSFSLRQRVSKGALCLVASHRMSTLCLYVH